MNQTVLVVDDVEENRDILGRILHRKGFPVVFASDGHEAIKLARESSPGLILLDINMPELDGFEVCRILKSDPELAIIPVIFISARTDTVDKLEAFGVGGVDYVTKPFDFREVIARVNTHLEMRRLQTDLEAANSRLKSSYEQLKEIEGMRDRLISMIIHDMRAPLALISSALEMIDLETRDLTNDETKRDLRVAGEGTARIAEMVDNILVLRKLESREVPLSIERHDAQTLLESALAEVSAVTHEHSVRLEVEKGSVLFCDEEYLKRVVQNLVTNAVKAMSQPGTICVGASSSDDYCEIFVEDAGVGIEPEAVGKIFDTFVSGNSVAGYDSKKSVGLGLAFCRLAAEAHGGEIAVTSTRGTGSRFTVRLPNSAPVRR